MRTILFIFIFSLISSGSSLKNTLAFESNSRIQQPVINGVEVPRCETICHTPENVKITKALQVEDPECSQCHVGERDYGNPEFVTQNLMARADKKNVKKPPRDMALIPAGEFIMGSNDRWDDEGPEYKTSLPDFYIDIYEVSNLEYKEFVEANKHRLPNHWIDGTFPAGKGSHPVVYVNWFEADAYCKWVGKRLPTQEEWEKAARGPNGLEYPFGNSFDPAKTNNPVKGSTGTEPVDSYPEGRSPYGLYNMSGNVWEWTSSWYKAYPNNKRPRKNYGEKNKVLKGGSWYNCESYDCGISAPNFNRAPFDPYVKSNSFGFRCAKDIDEKN